ncbi:Nucleoside-diphosphate-sugar epimerase [Methanonatronarchaeum thermophilum]|uniref:Nucleoside-diphosphate-sugar epimerase n=1 Tax=Methanonatronarchaeum thermophilum TaxID=1927129 RepID=A0A1Y3GD40_9EURY|nr:GDP-mannose 4,6-dehydratase [Methanonatronarchaeum thermophilum]OUJ19309.1 Nucleoside-diphosphate-sugar epimerase [Methanonatronarchaeum thermophilum]
MKALITGSAGFIGSHLSQRLLEEGYDVVGIDNLNDYYPSFIKKKNVELCNDFSRNLDSKFNFVEGDILNQSIMEEVFDEFNFELVFHQAAQAGVRYSVENPIEPNNINVNGTLNLLETSRKNDVRLFINASSSSVYGETKYLPFDEKHPKTPKSPYGVSKLASEQYCRVFNELYDINTVSLRYFTVYGPRMRPDMAISNFVRRCLNNKSPIIYGNGKQTRDFTYIQDVTKANIELISKKEAQGEIINIGSGENISIKKLAKEIIKETNLEKEPIYSEKKKGDVKNTYADIKKAKKLINYEPKFGIKEGIKKYIDWYKKNKDWYKNNK